MAGAAVHTPNRRARTAGFAIDIARATLDARTIDLLDNARLLNRVRKLDKVELAGVWRLTRPYLAHSHTDPARILDPMAVHNRLLEGLSGEALLVSSAMFLNNLAEVEEHFELSFKTIKARLGHVLDTSASEKVMRAARTTMMAAEVLGDYDAARAYMHTRNFALGGAKPVDLVKTAEGERIVSNELQAHAESGPI